MRKMVAKNKTIYQAITRAVEEHQMLYDRLATMDPRAFAYPTVEQDLKDATERLKVLRELADTQRG